MPQNKISPADSVVTVVVRVRPLNELETRNSRTCARYDSDSQITLTKQNDPKTFTFDKVYKHTAEQKYVYESCARRILDKCMAGYNGCIFAYGQTGSGKTHTMEGTPNDPGVTSRLCSDLFLCAQQNANVEYTISMSYIEIYQETLVDLLSETNALKDLKIREDKLRGIYVQNVTQHPLESASDAEQLLNKGSKKRTVGETKMNTKSSRSHGIVMLNIIQRDSSDTEDLTRKEAKLNLIDLAGSERASASSGDSLRLKEGTAINQSLSALGNVINALVLNESHIPYRTSKLTRVLQDSLGGNSYTTMIAAVSPALINYEESVSTLRFANRAKQIKNKAVINRDPKAAKIAELMEEIARLKDRIHELESGQGVSSSGIRYVDGVDGRAHAISQPAAEKQSSCCCTLM